MANSKNNNKKDVFEYKNNENLNLRPINFEEVFEFSKGQSYYKKLRDYQQENKEKIYDAWARNKSSIMLQMPTGTGKTHLFSSIIKDLQDYFYEKLARKGLSGTEREKYKLPKILVLVHRKELVEQIEETLTNRYKHSCGIVMGSTLIGEKRNVIVASVQTLSRRKRLQSWEKNVDFDFIIVDEAHHSTADSYQRIRMSWPNARLLGVTATPYRLNHQPFTDIFDCLIVSKPVFEFIDQNYLCNYEYYSIRPDSQMQHNIDNLKIGFDGDYDEGAMETLLNNDGIRASVYQTYKKYADGKRGIVYTINQLHNKLLSGVFKKNGYKVAYIDSKTPKDERSETVNKFRNGEIDIIFNVNIFSEGFDCPDLEFVQLARPTKSLAMYLQQVGRGFRVSEGKEKVIFLDNVGLYNRFGLPSARRHWKHHFEGDENWEDEGGNNKEPLEEHAYNPSDLTEGDEEITKVYSSLDDKEIEKPEETLENTQVYYEPIHNNMTDDEIIIEINSIKYQITNAEKKDVLKVLLLIEDRKLTGFIDTSGIGGFLEKVKREKIESFITELYQKGYTKNDVFQFLMDESSKIDADKLIITDNNPASEKKYPPLKEGLYIYTRDGRQIQEKSSRQTFLKAIKEAGVIRVFELKIETLDDYLVSEWPNPNYPETSSFQVGGFYITIHHSIDQMIRLCEKINDKLDLGWTIGRI